MKFPIAISFILVGSLAACSSSPPRAPEKLSTAPVSSDDCLQVYDRVLSLKLEEVEAADDHPYTSNEKWAGRRLLDNEFRERGTTDAFLANCQTVYDQWHVSCIMRSVSIDGMSLCAIARK